MLHLEVVGGAAFLFEGLEAIESNDIDTIIRIEEDIKEIIWDHGVDINDDASEYYYDFEEFYFEEFTEMSFTNITITIFRAGMLSALADR